MNAEQLIAILELEQSKGYTDRAVSGGLDKLLDRLPKNAYKALLPPVPSYRAMDKTQREEWVTTTLRRISDHEKPPGVLSPLGPVICADSPVNALGGVSQKLAAKFGHLGVITIRDLLYFFPRRYIDYSKTSRISELEVGSEQTIVATIWEATERKSYRGMRSTEAILADDTGMVRAIWFNQPYLAKRLNTNTQIALSGRVDIFHGQMVFRSPEYEFIDSGSLIHTGRLLPVYPLTSGLYPRQVRNATHNAINTCLGQMDDFLPHEVRNRCDLMELSEAIAQSHFPDSEATINAARRRLAFDELFLIQLGVLAKRRERREDGQGITLETSSEYPARFLDSLPFELTSAQQSALREITHDLASDKPMSRLLQGDVGSGKTVIATAAMLVCVACGYQAALMAPTEILAVQHFENIRHLLGNEVSDERVHSSCDFTVGLLTGGMKGKAKKNLLQRVETGEIDILVGTHALIQKDIEFHRLGLAVVDEQHRFGVMQRLELRQKGLSPHLLVMSATPIPRTLALTLYGDLDISVIDELPPGRRQIKTRWLSPNQRQNGYDFVRTQVSLGHQVFIICPLIGESESINARAATTEYERLSQEVFPDLRLGLLHGRMSPSAKEEVMLQFRAGAIDVLVSTSVIEVGIDVPNATVMVVEGAERFGLSQLHQLRGRVWRSSHQSYCLLMSENMSQEGKERLSIMERTHDGFQLAEEDLRLRGPGDFFGTRQSGLPNLKMARLSDVQLLELARKEAIRLFNLDPHLSGPAHKALAGEVARLWEGANE